MKVFLSCFTTAFVLAELLRVDLQLTFLAPLVAGALAVGPAVGTIRLIVLPISAWLLAALAGVAMRCGTGRTGVSPPTGAATDGRRGAVVGRHPNGDVMQRPAVMVGIIIVLRADGESAAHVIRGRFVAALLGATAVVVWEVLWLARSRHRDPAGGLAVCTLGFVRRDGRRDRHEVAQRAGDPDGRTVFYQDADDRVWTGSPAW